ncbi:MAG TPA: hypothetical protein VHA06_24010 [Candidatus Angelobacter sp.]|jgi:hypothetical protein|nr:hypothetical protein [Candidatus Angelobacter sp.]
MVVALPHGGWQDPGAAVILLYGLLWIANVFMLASPWMLLRTRRGHGQICIAFLAVWDVLILVAIWVATPEGYPLAAAARVGYFLWQASVLGMTIFLWLVRNEAKIAVVSLS